MFDETVPTQFESRTGWRVLWATNEVIWYSERDDWGQLYLYDLQTGKLKNQITTGDGPVMQIARIDEKTRTLWFGANGRETGQDPYFLHFYRTSASTARTCGVAHAGRRHARDAALAVGQVPRRHVLEAGRAAGRRAARRPTAG